MLKAISSQGPSDATIAQIHQVQDLKLSADGNARAYILLAQQKYFFGRPESASTLLSRAIEYVETTGSTGGSLMIELQLMLAEVCISSEDIEAAQIAIDRAVHLQRNTRDISDLWLAKALTIKATLCLLARDDQTARNLLDKALEIWNQPGIAGQTTVPRPEFRHPDKAKVHLLLAAMLREQNQILPADEQWRLA